jgi:PAS domain S-box-containing protein
MNFLQEVLTTLGAYIPHEMFATFAPHVGRAAVAAHVALLYAYLFTALFLFLRRLFSGAGSKALLFFCLLGFGASLSGPVFHYLISNHVVSSAWEGLWHAAVLAPILMMLSRFIGHVGDDQGAHHEEPVAETHTNEWQKLMSLLSHTSDGLITVNRLGKIEMMNAAAERFLGVRQKEMVGQPLTFLAEKVKFYTDDHQLIPLQDWVVTRALREGTIANEQSVQLFPFRSKGIYLNVSASPLKNLKGEADTIICVLKDQTAHRQLEMLKEELFSKGHHGDEPVRPSAVPNATSAPAAQIPAAPAPAGSASPAPTASGAAGTTVAFLKAFLWEQSGEATRMGVSFLDQIPSVLPAMEVSQASLKKAMAYVTQYALHSTAAGGMVRIWASAKEDKVFIGIRDGGMGMIPDEVTRFSDQIDGLSTKKGDQQKNPLYPLILAKEEFEAMGLQLRVRSDGLKKGTEYYVLVPAVGSAPTPRAVIGQNPSQGSSDSPVSEGWLG